MKVAKGGALDVRRPIILQVLNLNRCEELTLPCPPTIVIFLIMAVKKSCYVNISELVIMMRPKYSVLVFRPLGIWHLKSLIR